MTDTVNTSFKRELPFSSRSMYLWTNHLEMESERSGWLMEFTNLLDDKKRLRRNWSVRIFHKRRKAFHQKWSLPLSEVWDHKQFEWITRWIGLQFNWDHWWTWGFSHRKPIRIGLWVGLKTLNILLKSRNCNAVIIFKLPAVLWVEIMFMNGCYDNNSSCEFRYISKDFKLQHL